MCRRTDIQSKILSNILVIDLGYETPCHIWQGSDSGTGRGGGYPRMSLDGQTVAVHIVAFTNKNGFVPGKKQIDHKCNNRMCVNEDHLQMVTHKKNQKLRVKRSRKETNVVPAEHCQLRCDDTPVYDRRGEDLSELQGILGPEDEASQDALDGRYLPDSAFWSNPSDVCTGSSHPAP